MSQELVMEDRPVLWHIPISHYSEKVRWALDHKRVPHRRRAAPPGAHIALALWLTRGAGNTFPILELDGERFADSTAAIAALERRHPEHPLYPTDPGERQRGLDLEDLFDEELGPHARLLPLHEMHGEPALLGDFAARSAPPALARAKPLLGVYARFYTGARFGVDDDKAAALARAKIVTAIERIEAELAAGDGLHLVGERFSVADLTAASLLYLVVLPAGGPLPPDLPQPPRLAAFREELRARPGGRWVEETYQRYR
jgi:glutathione S-transferase